jgi:hypothetical protein
MIRALQDAQNQPDHSNKVQKRPFYHQAKVCLLRNFCQGQDECRSFIFFFMESALLTKVSQQAHGRLAVKNGEVGSGLLFRSSQVLLLFKYNRIERSI